MRWLVLFGMLLAAPAIAQVPVPPASAAQPPAAPAPATPSPAAQLPAPQVPLVADLASHLGPPVVHALWRVRPTRAQVGLPAAARRRNVRGAFVASLLLGKRRRAAYISGRVVALVDDVRTTGATLHECAAVLRAMGASEVRILTLAQAPAPES